MLTHYLRRKNYAANRALGWVYYLFKSSIPFLRFLLICFFIGVLQFPTVANASPPDWVPTTGMQYAMQVVCVIELEEGTYTLDANDIIGAFVGDECRGIASPLAELNGLCFLSIASNQSQGEAIHFKAYISQHDQVFDVNESFNFEHLGEIGDFTNPFVFTLVALPPPNFYIIQASTNEGGNIIPEGNISVLAGSDQQFDLFPNTGFHIDSVIVDGINQGIIAIYFFENITSNHSISAFFGINEYILTYLNGDNGILEGELIQIIPYGNDGTAVLAVANEGYNFEQWSDGVLSNPRIDTNVTADLSVYPQYEAQSFSISSTSTAGGFIEPAGTFQVNFGENMTFIVAADIGYEYTSLLVDGINVGNPASYTFENISDNHSIHANFNPRSYTIEASCGENGSISPSGIVNISHGASQLFEIRPEIGFQVEDVIVDNHSQGPISSYLFENVTENHTIAASFSIYTDIEAFSGASAFKLFPNPAKDYVRLSFPKDYSTTVLKMPYQIKDVLGQIVLAGIINETTTLIDISELYSGLYILIIDSKKHPHLLIKK